MKKKKSYMEDVYYISSSLTFFFSKANIIKYFKNMSNCKNSITIINEISLSLSLYIYIYIYLSIYLSIYIYIYLCVRDHSPDSFLVLGQTHENG